MGESPYLLVILASGDLKIWDLAERKLVLASSIEAITNVSLPAATSFELVIYLTTFLIVLS